MLTKLRLENFKVFEEQEISFMPGTTSIVGPNGSGKTTLLESIEFALFRAVTRKEKKIARFEDLIRHGQDSAKVELGFIAPSNKREFRVVRSIFPGKTTADLYQENRPSPVESGPARVDKEVISLLGVDRNAFSALTYVRQGEIDLLSRLSPKLKREHLYDMMGLGVYNTTVDRVEKKLKDYESQLGQIDSSRESLAQIRGHLPTKEDIESALNSLESLEKTIGKTNDVARVRSLILRVKQSLEDIERELTSPQIEAKQKDLRTDSETAKNLRRILVSIPLVAEEQLRPRIREEARNIFLSIFGDRYSDFLVDDGYEVSLVDLQGNRVSLMAASGGEDVCVNFALRVAVNSALQKYSTTMAALGLLILDEPGAGLDAQRRRWLPAAISGLEGIGQVLVITHMEELRESADRVISLIPQGRGRQPLVEIQD